MIDKDQKATSPSILGIDTLSTRQLQLLLQESGDIAQHIESGQPVDRALHGKIVASLFFENSTRTVASFDFAAQKLGARIFHLAVDHSSLNKGETYVDTVATINAMHPDAIIVRHSASGAATTAATVASCGILNAGDGTNEHPLQALGDALTLLRTFGRIDGLKVAICGDILHSRVARSNILLLSRLGAAINVVGPESLLPDQAGQPGVKLYTDLKAGIANADVIMGLRIQQERMEQHNMPDPNDYYKTFGLNQTNLENAPSAMIMHPGPINRGVEIQSEVADGPRSLILAQITHGTYARMAALKYVCGLPLSGSCTTTIC